MEISANLTGLKRRAFLQAGGLGLGRIALAALLADDSKGRAAAASTPTPRAPHFAPQVDSVIHLFMAGAPSQLDLFDYKPLLAKMEGKPIPPSVIKGQRYAFIRPDAAVLGPRFKFAKHGQAGIELSEVLPQLAKVVDDVAFIRSMHTDQFNHAPGQLALSTGFSLPGRPCMGAWTVYGLGSATEDLPAYVVLTSGGNLSGGAAMWSSGFLPSKYTGVRFRDSGDPILHVSNPPGVDGPTQRRTLDLIGRLNRREAAVRHDPEIETRIAAYEMAYRLQTSAPELTDLRDETVATLKLYGADPAKPSFARNCLLARRMVERGVRFITLFKEGWDAHSDVAGNLRRNCGETDQACAALLMDLKRRGLLERTLVVWGGEFGRTPMVEASAALGRSLGRDHHPQAFTTWLAGGGVRGGLTYGATDELGFHPVENPVHVRDLHATILQQLGIDHERLTFAYAGLDFRLTGVELSRVVREILR